MTPLQNPASLLGIAPPAAHAGMPRFGLIVVGDEILSGRRTDQHVAKTIELLSRRGLALSYVHMVGDDRDRQAALLREAFASGDVVFSCGGIGATPDDHTRQAAAQALGVPLLMHPVAREWLLERLQDVARERNMEFEPDRPDNLQRLQMAVFPQGAQVIPNPYNKIAGFSVGHVHFVPGFPVMAWPMMEWVLDNFYSQWHDQRRWQECSVIVLGAYEATLTPLMQQIENSYPGTKVFSLPSVNHPEWGMHIELGVKGDPQFVSQAFEDLLVELERQGYEMGPRFHGIQPDISK